LIVPDVIDSDSGHGARGCDLAVVDTAMDSIDSCNIIRSIRRDTNVPVLVLSDPKSDQTITARALANGADDYLFKPIEIIDMIFHMEAVATVRLAK
jgi:DNA-binding response OmpR family regulator